MGEIDLPSRNWSSRFKEGNNCCEQALRLALTLSTLALILGIPSCSRNYTPEHQRVGKVNPGTPHGELTAIGVPKLL